MRDRWVGRDRVREELAQLADEQVWVDAIKDPLMPELRALAAAALAATVAAENNSGG